MATVNYSSNVTSIIAEAYDSNKKVMLKLTPGSAKPNITLSSGQAIECVMTTNKANFYGSGTIYFSSMSGITGIYVNSYTFEVGQTIVLFGLIQFKYGSSTTFETYVQYTNRQYYLKTNNDGFSNAEVTILNKTQGFDFAFNKNANQLMFTNCNITA